jgi:hypothetical protein
MINHAMLGGLCVTMCVLFTWALDNDRQKSLTTSSTELKSKHQDDATIKNERRRSFDKMLKLGSIILGCAIGYTTHMTAMIVVLTHFASSNGTYCILLVAAGAIVTLLQSWITWMHLRCETSSCLHFEFILWIGASLICFLSGFFGAWVITDYWTGNDKRIFYHIVLEGLCLAKFLLLIWAVVFAGPSNSECASSSQQEDHDETFNKTVFEV